MSAHKHTPGPWKVLNARKEDWLGRPLEYWTVTADDRDKWLCASPEWDPEHEAESEANARLIAAAPENYQSNVELAAIVRELCAAYGHPLPQASLDRSDAAIEKATGGAA